MKLQIDRKVIGDGYPTYIIAEIGINHNGDEAVARRLIDAAVEAKADAVKFQKRHLPSLYRQELLDHPEKYEQNFQYMIPLLKKIELSDESYVRLRNYCDEKGISFLCTPFDKVSADFLKKIDVHAYKIASADLTNSSLLQHIGSFKKPMILSTGMSSWEEVETAVAVMKKTGSQFALLHCKSVYPVWPRDVNLHMINRLRQYGVPVGYSGHEVGITISLVAASMGANIIEKHVTLDKKMEGPDHKLSLEPHELRRLIRDIRVADESIGNTKRIMLRGEVMNREVFGKSLIAACKIAKGGLITSEMVDVMGPGKGLAPDKMEKLIGLKAKRDIQAGDFFLDNDISDLEEVSFNAVFESHWGLVARYSDFKEMMVYKPRIIEFHLAEMDLHNTVVPDEAYDCGLVVHAPEYLGEKLMDLCSLNEELRKKSAKLVRDVIGVTCLLAKQFKGTPKVIAHPGAMSFQGKLDKKLLRMALSRSLAEIREDPDAVSVELLFENLPPYPWYFGGQWKGNYFMSADEITDFCKENQMKICFDLSHSALYCNAKEIDLAKQIKTMLPYTSHLHLADGYGLDGEGVQFGEGSIDLKSIIPLFKNFQGSWIPEIWRGHLNNGYAFLEALNYLKQYHVF
ncbi:MAG: N-acetylneuraminate synthase family protein [Proteobacteria bacterium]|nr:N-acetylneuraminate synthase family protein [Pseudomonadota bacterium]